MANTFKRKIGSTATAGVPLVVYTVPPATTTVVIGCLITNITANLINVSITAAGTSIGDDIPLPANSVLAPIEGKLVVEATDTITVEADADNSAKVVLSIMEIT